MSRLVWITLILFSFMFIVACEDSGCPEGQREYNGECVPESSGDQDYTTPPGTTIFPDGDTSTTIPQGGEGRCGLPYEYDITSGRSSAIKKSGSITNKNYANSVTGASCVPKTIFEPLVTDGDAVTETDSDTSGGGDADAIESADNIVEQDSDMVKPGPGQGPQIVAKIVLNAEETLNLSFTGDGFDAVVYILTGCTDTSVCKAGVIDYKGQGEGETFSYFATAKGDYYIIFDTKTGSAKGDFTYEITVSQPVDGDTDTAPADGDVTETSEISDKPTETDTSENTDNENTEAAENTDGDVADAEKEEEAAITIEYPNISGTYVIELSSDPIFTDLAFPTGNSPLLLHLMNDTEVGTKQWDMNKFSFPTTPPVKKTVTGVVRGIAFYGTLGDPTYLDKQNKVIKPTEHGEITYPGDSNDEPTGLALLNGEYWVSESTKKRLYRLTWNGSKWVSTYFTYTEFKDLTGVTSDGKNIFIVNQTDTDSEIYKIDPTNGKQLVKYVIKDNLFSGISYNAETGSMFATIANHRRVVQLESFIN